MSMGVAGGPADVVVGDGPQRPLFLVGPTVTRTIGMEAAASSGQILVDEPTATAIGPAACRPAAPGAWAVRTRRASGDEELVPSALDALPPSGRPELHLPAALRARMTAGDLPPEHRPITTVFVMVGGLDATAVGRGPADLLRRVTIVAGEAGEELEVALVQTDIGRDGARFAFVAGLPVRHDDDELRAVALARRLVDSDVGARMAIGVHGGVAFVGDVGHPDRRAYTMNADCVNVAARLMSMSWPGHVLASGAVVERLRGQFAVVAPRTLALKGKRPGVSVAEIAGPAAEPEAAARPLLIGRDDEVRLLWRALGAHRAGTGAVVEVVAPAGMGKTHVIEDALASVRPALRVEGEVALQVVPFGVLARPLRTALDIDGPAPLVEAFGDMAPLVAPALGLSVPPTPATRAIAVAGHLGRGNGLDPLRDVLADARRRDGAIEVVRCLQALEELDPAVDPAWAAERGEAHAAALGVTWTPPLTLRRDPAGGHTPVIAAWYSATRAR